MARERDPPSHTHLAQWDQAIAPCLQSMARSPQFLLPHVDPNLAEARALMGSALAYMGRAQEAEAHVLEALRLSPRDAMIFEWFLVAGSAKMLLGEFAEASAWLRKSIDANRNRPLAFFLLAACLAHLGRLDEARREVKAGLTVDPDLTLRRFRAGAQSDNAVYLAQRARVIEGMRLAGVPEG